jgi:hypothetical protein
MNNIPAHELLNPKAIFARYGYQIFRGDFEKFILLKQKFSDYIAAELSKYGVDDESNFKLENYHNAFLNEPMEHYKFIDKIKRIVPPKVISTDEPMIGLILEQASDIFGRKASVYNEKIEFRVVRPNSPDNNTLHRDHWFPYFKPLINIYLPLASSYSDSAMKVVPGSHLWSDEDVVPEFPYEGGKRINSAGVAFSTPGIKQTNKLIKEHRPDILEGDFMLFSPMSVHGGGDNFSPETRFSFEIRIELK